MLLLAAPSARKSRRDTHAGSLAIARDRWRDYFAGIRARSAQLAAVDVLGASGDVPRAGRALPLRTISYDPRTAELELELRINGAVLRHFIAQPREITVLPPVEDSRTELLVLDASGTRTRIVLSEPIGSRLAHIRV
jgi:hypothetical protein